jgi:hypothetical protein
VFAFPLTVDENLLPVKSAHNSIDNHTNQKLLEFFELNFGHFFKNLIFENFNELVSPSRVMSHAPR